MRFLSSLLVLSFASVAFGDLYLHGPRGSNNRLNEQNAERNNGNRLFDSENNGRGGYNVGDKSENPATAAASDVSSLYDVTQDQNIQYSMLYYEGSILTIEWTNQHGCGGNEATDPQQQNCELILQYMCETDNSGAATSPNNPQGVSIYTDGSVTLRDGTTTNTPDLTNDSPTTGLHESRNYYSKCSKRSRNKGLFTADQQLGNVNGFQSAIFTRQNPNANDNNRHGLECPEERDYYPYWSPSPWRDIAILTDKPERCPYYLANSQNTASVGQCENGVTGFEKAITATDCTTNYKGTWKLYSHGISPPLCQQAPWSRVNHLGNVRGNQPLTFNWTLPQLASMYGISKSAYGTAKCVLRMRYNISADDYDPVNTDASFNKNKATGVVSPVTTNPIVDVGAQTTRGLRLNVNTAQFGRTFQDRSHVFYIRAIPSSGPLHDLLVNKTIHNLTVRGKRGNIAQTYPAVEYDFQPNRIEINANTDILHIQWTGSNTHNNGGGGGDGQAGDAGEGKEGTDRNNMMCLKNFGDNYPMPLDKFTANLFTQSLCYAGWDGSTIGGSDPQVSDCAVLLATSGFFRTAASVSTSPRKFDPLLNNAPASLVSGVFMMFPNKPSTTTEYYYMCSRNNNFSNRSQKGTIVLTTQ